LHPAPGYPAQALIRRGDPTFPGANVLDTHGTSNAWLLRPGSATAQRRQFGYICDAIAFFPLEHGRRRGLRCATTSTPTTSGCSPAGWARGGRAVAGVLADRSKRHPEAVPLEMAAHGLSVLEIELVGKEWRPRLGSHYNRGITARTPAEVNGPAPGHALLCANADASGTRVFGTLANCSGRRTPWARSSRRKRTSGAISAGAVRCRQSAMSIRERLPHRAGSRCSSMATTAGSARTRASSCACSRARRCASVPERLSPEDQSLDLNGAPGGD
jgi:hypothetical protein